MSATQDEPFTGVKQEADGWSYYLRGSRVGQRHLFNDAQGALRELQGLPPVLTIKVQAPAGQVATTPPEPGPVAPAITDPAIIPAIEAELLPKDGSDVVVVITTGQRSWPGSIVVKGETVEAVIHNGVRRPPLRPTGVTEAILALEKRGYRLEMSPDAHPFAGRPIGTWHRLPARGYLQERKAARFVRTSLPA